MTREEIIKIIDFSRLKRNYLENPIIKQAKPKDIPFKEDLEYLYLELNLDQKEISNFLGYQTIGRVLRSYKIIKPDSLKYKCRVRRNLEKYGVESPSTLKEVKEKLKQTCLERYGVTSTNKLPEKIKARINTCYKKYNKGSNTKVGRRWELPSKELMLELYINQRKTKKEISNIFNISIFKVNDIITTYKLKEKKKDLATIENEKIFNTYKFNINNAKFFVEKYKIDLSKLKRNYLENPLKRSKSNRFFKELPEKEDLEYLYCELGFTQRDLAQFFGFKMICNWLCKLGITRSSKQKSNSRKLNILRKFGTVENFKQKEYQTKKLHHSFNISREEGKVFNLLFQKFSDTLTQYKSEKYPFNCDFYIPSKDLYIELNFHWTHGYHPFNKNNQEDLRTLEKWKERSLVSKFYKNAIETWTIRNVRKREIAKANNLNYLEFFNMQEFMSWFEKQ